MKAFVVSYGIQFSDTMAYGSHHFLTNLRFQCFARETLLFGPHFRALPGLEEQFGDVVLLTAEGYTRNLAPALLGEKVLVLTSIEEKNAASFRFCFRVLKEDGTPVCAGFQTIVCASKATGAPCAFPEPLERGFPLLAEATESGPQSFRDKVLRGAVKELMPEVLQSWVRSETHPGGLLDADRLGGGRLLDVATAVTEGTVLLFPGQGGYQPADHAAFRDLCSRSPEYAAAEAQLEAICRDELGASLREFVGAGGAAAAERLLAAEPELDQVAVYLIGVLAGRERARALGASERVVHVGHSLGEIAALACAGAYTIEDGLRIICRRSRTLSREARDSGVLAAISCGKTRALEILAGARAIAPRVVLAGVNHPRQSVLAGPAAELARLAAETLTPLGIGMTRLRSRYPFHSPALDAVRRTFLAAIRPLPAQTPIGSVVSAIDARSYAGAPGTEIAERLADHLIRPFEFESLVARLSAAGYARWVECGVRPMLSEIVKRCQPAQAAAVAAAPAAPAPSSTPDAAPSVTPPAPAPAPGPAYAIVGAGCVLPGAGHLADYEAALLDGRSGIVDVRTIDLDFQRDFQSEEKREAKTYSALSGRVADHLITCPAEVPGADFGAFTRPQKLLAMALAEAVRPCAPATAGAIRAGDGTCVIVGATADGCDEFEQALLREDIEARLPARRAQVRSLFDASAQADSAALSLRPSIHQAVRAVCGRELPLDVLDAACASSLFAVHSGMHRLATGRAKVVLAGGVFSPGPGNSCLFAQFGGLSADGSRPFDVSANGVVFGEGAAFVVLKTLEAALADGDRVLGVIRGSGLSSDGKSSSANVPRAAGQKLAMQRAYGSSGLAPASVQYVEAHGTATPRGDATEIESIGAVFAGRPDPLVLGSVKAQIGHTGWTAGTASLLKACFFLREGRFPVQHGLRQVSAEIARHEGRLHVPTREEAWPAPGSGEPRRAGVNGFGFGGTNAHVIVEQFVPAYHERWRSFRPAAAPEPRFVVVGRALFVPDAEGGLATDATAAGAASFSRTRIPLPARVPMLPDLHESLDVGQLLALRAVEAALASAPGLDKAVADAHAATAVIVSLEGRALSGIQSSQKIYRDRLLRKGAGWQDALAPALDVVEGEPVRLGAYTLQGMMQNVVSGRIANGWDLQGPNFVLEAGEGGFSAALAHGRSCLEEGSEFAIVAAMQANARFPRTSPAPMREAVAVWVVASEDTARARSLAVLGEASVERRPAPAARWSFGAADDFPELHAAASEAPAEAAASGFSVEATLDAYTPTWRPATLPAGPARAPRTVLLVDGAEAASARPWLAGLGWTVIDESAPATREADLVLAVVDGAALGVEPFAAIEQARPRFERFAAVLTSRYAAIAEGRTRVVALSLGAADEEGCLEPWTGLYAGALKSLARECPAASIGCWVSDVHAPGPVWDALAPSLEQPGLVREMGWIRGRVLERALRAAAFQPAAAAAQPVTPRLGRDSVVVLTGGARGVTAVLAEALLRRSGCALVLVGRSSFDESAVRPLAGEVDPAVLGRLGEAEWAEIERGFYARLAGEAPLPRLRERWTRLRASVEAWATVQRLQAVAAEAGAAPVVYLTADVTDPGSVTRALEEATAARGPISWIIHGAGVQTSKKLSRRTPAEWKATLDTKVSGLAHLRAAARAVAQARGHAEPAYHALSSAFSFFGNDGQADYGAANEVLDRLCTRLSAEGSFSSIAWPAWDRIGMTRGSEFEVLGAGRQLRGVGAEEGGRLFADFVDAARVDPVTLLFSEIERRLYDVPVVREQVLTPAPITLQTHPVIADHRARGSVVVPGAYLLDYVAEAVLVSHPGHRVAAISQIHFDRFARLTPDAFRFRLRLQYLEETADTLRLRCLVESDLFRPDGRVLRAGCRFAECVLDLSRGEPALGMAAPPSRRRKKGTAAPDPYLLPESPVSLAGAFDCLRDIELFNDGSRSARVEIPSASVEQRTAGRVLPALVLDASWRLSGMYATGDGAVAVPWQFSRIELGTSAPTASRQGLLVRSLAPRVRGAEIESPGFEVADDSGRLLIRGTHGIARLASPAGRA